MRAPVRAALPIPGQRLIETGQKSRSGKSLGRVVGKPPTESGRHYHTRKGRAIYFQVAVPMRLPTLADFWGVISHMSVLAKLLLARSP